ncbi:hypothetical protein PHMEG_00021533 [Phytophthora megakarya]|uniref:Uncharacterized protein n=1 Tax=Phytophthora megakarya TaxID=4795 RepID=A0A225VMJ2_9STRA|nr:hypothetical protein PHMEG_00021533 [Phytophthora megakarya]
MVKALIKYFKGLKGKRATAAARGEVRAKTGNDPLSFDLSAKAFGIHHGHMEWSGYAFCIYFAHQKNDQEGSRPSDPRHIYANPLNPVICPVLAIAKFWATSSFDGSVFLFPDSNQYERFHKCLHRLLERDGSKDEIRRRGVNQDDLGTHPIRKGAATYCASGSTSCPSSTAVHLRAGWSLGGVQNTYLRYKAAGDMHVVKTMSGLPSGSQNFAVLPSILLNMLLSSNKRLDLSYVGEFCLATLVYHALYLQKKLSVKHPLLESPLFQHPTLITDLSAKLCGIDATSNRLQATVVPPLVAILREIKSLLEVALETIDHGDTARAATVRDIIGELEQRAIGAGVVTFDGLDSAIQRYLTSAGVTDLVEKLNSNSQHTSSNELTDNTLIPPSVFCLGAFHWVLSFLIAQWQCCGCCGSGGNNTKNIPPVRMLDGHDMSTTYRSDSVTSGI